eukprot:2453918-Rhodomonas_salina.1
MSGTDVAVRWYQEQSKQQRALTPRLAHVTWYAIGPRARYGMSSTDIFSLARSLVSLSLVSLLSRSLPPSLPLSSLSPFFSLPVFSPLYGATRRPLAQERGGGEFNT